MSDEELINDLRELNMAINHASNLAHDTNTINRKCSEMSEFQFLINSLYQSKLHILEVIKKINKGD